MSAVVLAVANQKGGVGKTTTAVNLGAALAERGRRILLVDGDPQANLTAALGLPKDGPSTYDLLLGDAAPADIRRQATGAALRDAGGPHTNPGRGGNGAPHLNGASGAPGRPSPPAWRGRASVCAAD